MFNYLKKASMVFFLFLVFVFRAEASQIGLDKSKVRLIIPPEGSQAGEIKIDNFSEETVNVKVYLEDWVYQNSQDGQKDFFPKGSQVLSCSDWISLSPVELTLPPFGKQSVNYVVKVPAQAQGGHYSVMFFETSIGKYDPGKSAEAEARSVGINVSVRIGALFYVEVKDTIKKDVQLSNLSVTGNSQDNPLAIDLDLKNTGNVDVTTMPFFHIMDKQGMVYARAEFNEVYTMPGDNAKLTAKWPKQISPGVYDLVLTFNLDKANEEAGRRRGPALVKEAELEIGQDGQIKKAGELK